MGVVVILEEESDAFALGCAVSRAFPLYNRKTSNSDSPQREAIIALMHMEKGAASLPETTKIVAITADGIRSTQRLVDMPPNELTVDRYVT